MTHLDVFFSAFSAVKWSVRRAVTLLVCADAVRWPQQINTQHRLRPQPGNSPYTHNKLTLDIKRAVT